MAGEAVPIIQQLREQAATAARTSRARSLSQISSKEAASARLPITIASAIPLHGSTLAAGSIKKLLLPARQGSGRGRPNT